MLIDGRPPTPVALSNVEQHSWLGYYLAVPPGVPATVDTGSGQVSAASQETLELRLSRFAGEGVHEDLDLTNFTQQETSFELGIELDGDLADQVEANGGRRLQHGEVSREWGRTDGVAQLTFTYRAGHEWSHHGDRGTSSLHRGLGVRVRRSDSAPRWERDRLAFRVTLPPRGRCHACLDFLAFIDGEWLRR